jgi:hypothetical protein
MEDDEHKSFENGDDSIDVQTKENDDEYVVENRETNDIGDYQYGSQASRSEYNEENNNHQLHNNDKSCNFILSYSKRLMFLFLSTTTR